MDGAAHAPTTAGGEASQRHLTRLAELIAAHPMVLLSGERLAEELGVSRSSVWRGIEQLRRYGVRLRGHRATGYQLEAAPDLLLPSLVAPLRRGNLGRPMRHYFRVGSTQREATEAARRGAPHGALFVAEEQTAGRGRQGHGWDSAPAQGIYMSLVLRPDGPPAQLLAWTLGAGVAAAAAMESAAGVRPDLRWPNDLMLGEASGEKKVGGLLLEMSGEATRTHYAVLGIGVNVGQEEFPGELAETATSLRRAGAAGVARARLLAEMLRQLETRWDRFASGGAAELMAEFEGWSSYARGRAVRVGTGAEAYEGVTEGLDALGFLRVRRRDGATATVISGDVRPLSQ